MRGYNFNPFLSSLLSWVHLPTEPSVQTCVVLADSRGAIIRPYYGVVVTDRATHRTTVTLLNSAGTRGQHSCMPGLIDGPISVREGTRLFFMRRSQPSLSYVVTCCGLRNSMNAYTFVGYPKIRPDGSRRHTSNFANSLFGSFGDMTSKLQENS